MTIAGLPSVDPCKFLIVKMARVSSFWFLTLPFLFSSCVPEEEVDQRVVTLDRGAYNPAVSPDGTTIAFANLGKIWLVPMEGGTARQLTFGTGWDHHPVWSPDGKHLAYIHDSPASSEILLHNFTTGTTRTLYGRSPQEVTGSPSWRVAYSFGKMAFHPTDGRLYFVDFRSGIWSVELSGLGKPEQFLEGSKRLGRPGITERSTFAFSPDGTTTVVEKDTQDQYTLLHLGSFNDAELTRITATEKVKHTDVSWLPDGSAIAFLELAGGVESLLIQNTTGTAEPRRIELGAYNGRELALHPDGKRAVLVAARQLFSVELATGAVAPIPFQAKLAQPRQAQADLVITNARLFDATGAPVLQDATVEIRDGKITAVSTGPYRGDAKPRMVDARGRFLMPGLIEGHGHLWIGSSLSMGNTLSRGVTSIFDPGSFLPETLSIRDAIAHGLLEGPHIYTSGPTVDGPEGRGRYFTLPGIAEPDHARALIREFNQLGVDAIKIYAFLEPDIVTAVIDEAHKHGIPVVGDLVYTTWAQALDAGIDGFIHVMDHKWRFIAAHQPDPSEGPWAVVDPDETRMNEFFAQVAAKGAMFDPTIMASSQFFKAGEFAAALEASTQEKTPANSDEEQREQRGIRRAAILADLMRAMHNNGVRWVAGTDAGASLLIEEMEIYEIIGIPNDVILQTATANVARWLKKEDFGTVEPGKRADLILVDGDPLTRIRDLEKVVVVVQSGRVVREQ